MGAAVFFLLHIYRYFSFRRSLKRVSYASSDESADKILRDEARAINISSAPPVRISSVTGTPMLVGILRPLLILSEREYSDDELRLIFRHELTHYKRKDILYQFIILIFLSLHWFNPFAYIMAKAAEIDGETACDEQVLKGEEYETRVFYGEMLIKLLKSQNQKNHI